MQRRRVLVGVGAILVVGLVGLVVYRVVVSGSDDGGSSVADDEGSGEDNLGPASSRLRGGARQIEDAQAARGAARAALLRVHAEIAEATDPAEIERLRRKQELIEGALEEIGVR